MRDTLLDKVFEYHESTKHHFDRYARGPGRLDWSSQPDPFRRYDGAPVIALESIPPVMEPSQGPSGPLYDDAFVPGAVAPEPLTFETLSRLLFDSLAVSAWKSAGGEAWALRVNPSSGNLHPTEGYVLCGPLGGLSDNPVICHYAPRIHSLEVRAELPMELWGKFVHPFPAGTLFVGLTSIHWREAWKYGERAYRYCQLDIGHALAAVRMAAAGLGWRACLLEGMRTEQLRQLLGVGDSLSPEAEEPDCLMALFPWMAGMPFGPVPDEVFTAAKGLDWKGEANILSRSHVHWQAVETVAEAVRKSLCDSPSHHVPGGWEHGEGSILPGKEGACDPWDPAAPHGHLEKASQEPRDIFLRSIVRRRRSAPAMDGTVWTDGRVFLEMLQRTMPPHPGSCAPPFDILPWRPRVHLALFVHRVRDLVPGLYFLVRDTSCTSDLQSAMQGSFSWTKPEACPKGLGFYLLAEGDTRRTAMQVACFQEIASDGCFSVAMIADFESGIRKRGAWFYPRLFWECGAIGQVFYLEAEAAGLRGTGIGCFFDDPVHELLGLKGRRYQDLYHFTVGGVRKR